MLYSFYVFVFPYLRFLLSSEKKIYLRILFLFTATLCIRLYYNQQDPYLHNWDERFHALVAKNMMSDPFKPMLRIDALLPYNYQDWWDNHIWVHKQPLFLWQMALSMKVFGVNEFAVRFPSALMCALLSLIIFRIGIVINKPLAGFSAAFLFCFSFFSIEQTCGAIGMDHNDVAMGFYVTASIWCLLEYYHSNKKYWLILLGIFSGCAILVKWLIGVLVYGCWSICILLQNNYKKYFHELLKMILPLTITSIIFIPWQVYIIKTFPEESKYVYEFNRRHITEALEGHTGNIFIYLKYINTQYSLLGIPIILSGILLMLRNKIQKEYKIILSSAIFIIYFFFSVVVATKAAGYVYIISPFVLLIIGLNFDYLHSFLLKKFPTDKAVIILSGLLFITCFMNLQYLRLNKSHFKGHSDYNVENKKNKINNTTIYKSLDSYLNGNYVVLNGNSVETAEAMFYSNQNVYGWWPDEPAYNGLKAAGYKIAAFTDHGKQLLPPYIKNDPDVVIIDKVLQ
ncbi:MAG: glycosyltransferase family 39 protein [Fimbriimonadaceae bacterium]|nr:glycosyltransferase family 39 protein [Chitinophagales bacterium]